MSKKVFISALAVGALLGVGSFAVAASPNQGAFPKFEFSNGLRSSTSNSGSETDIKTLKKELVKLFEADYALGNLTPKQQQNIGNGSDGPGLEKLRRELDEVWVPEVARDYFDSIVEMFKAEDGSGLDLTFTSAKFVVEKWEGIQVSESDATALVTGHYETYGKNGKIQDASSQWLVSLNRDAANHKWLLADRKGVRIED